ncbi:nucleoside phosphorylase [Archangium gephyra]|uniref:Kinesin light chain-like protein n=1 Tax=Archangium gephyra TaxID=48 RepID=A0AAC8TB09_9BACT|nr:tetratricopeptide repeat protein [Archangium gephyra]AKI99142.1 kinesin light chain-like protein [Archangium gephyra]REG31049.1 nucleoside phosphorylase [Archangium gephyra]
MAWPRLLRRFARPPVDIAILTVIPPELYAVRQALGLSEVAAARETDETGTISYRGPVHSTLAGRDHEVLLTCIGRAGNNNSAAAVQEVISRYAPRAVLLVGIAAGIRGKVRIGEVVLSERVVAYESAALVRTPEGGSRTEPRPEIRTTSHGMHQNVVHYRPEAQRLDTRFQARGWSVPRPSEGREKLFSEHVASRMTVKAATIASGEKLLRDPGKLLEIRSLDGRTEVGEMEAAGLMAACERNGIPWLVIRGISDFGDELKDDHFHEYASRTAAIVLADFLEQGLELPRPPRKAPVAAGLAVLALAAGAGVLAWSPWSGAEGLCGEDLGPSPFKNPGATHLLVAGFQGSSPQQPDFSRTVSEQVAQALERFQEEELRNPKEVDLEVPEGSLELHRLSCTLDTHERAERVAQALGANVILWGKAFNGPASTPYTVQPRATLYSAERSFRRSSKRALELPSLGHLDLPALRATEPFQLIQFALGLHFHEQEQYALAARFFEKSAEHVLEQERNVESLELVLARAYLYLPDLERSLRYSRQALARVRGSGSPQEVTSLSLIGNALMEQGDLAGALEHQWQALALMRRRLGENHPALVTYLSSVGHVLMAQGDYTAARTAFQQGLELVEKTYGPEHLEAIRPLNNLGTALSAQGELEAALAYHRRALAIADKAPGGGNPNTRGVILNNLGHVLDEQGQYPEAQAHFQQALLLAERALGRAHPDVAIALNNLGLMHYRQGHREEALAHYERAISISEKALGPENPQVPYLLANLAGLLVDQGERARGLALQQRALALHEKFRGRNHPDLLFVLNNIGTVLAQGGDGVGAAGYLRRALAIAEQSLGEDHSNTRKVRSNLALALAGLSGWRGGQATGGAIVTRCLGISCREFVIGDWIIAVGGKPLRDHKHLFEMLSGISQDVRITVRREGKTLHLPLVPEGCGKLHWLDAASFAQIDEP